MGAWWLTNESTGSAISADANAADSKDQFFYGPALMAYMLHQMVDAPADCIEALPAGVLRFDGEKDHSGPCTIVLRATRPL